MMLDRWINAVTRAIIDDENTARACEINGDGAGESRAVASAAAGQTLLELLQELKKRREIDDQILEKTKTIKVTREDDEKSKYCYIDIKQLWQDLMSDIDKLEIRENDGEACVELFKVYRVLTKRFRRIEKEGGQNEKIIDG